MENKILNFFWAINDKNSTLTKIELVFDLI